jgi:hypothetical protein
VDVITGLKAMTVWPAYQHFEEAAKGSIEVGKLADLVILSRDPTQGDPNTIDRIKVVETIKEGNTVFVLDAAEQRKAKLMPKAPSRGELSFARFLGGLGRHEAGPADGGAHEEALHDGLAVLGAMIEGAAAEREPSAMKPKDSLGR